MRKASDRKRRGLARKLGDLRRFAADYAGGLRGEDLRRLFDRDASQALDVLVGKDDSTAGRRPGHLERARRIFLGVSYRLTPARRLLFALSLVATILGLADFNAGIRTQGLSIDFSPFWFLTAIGILFFLLALELVEQTRVRDELEVARQLQRELLPAGLVELPGCRLSHTYRTANEVGGDFYDFQALEDGRVVLMIGDASGHGIAAGLLMATAKAALGVAMDLDPRPAEVATVLNRSLCRTGDRRTFMTLFYGLLDPMSGKLDYVCAGHPFPLLRRAGGGVEELGRGGLPLGLRPQLDLRTGATELAPGDLLLLYTDGLPEALHQPTARAFGFERLPALVSPGGEPETVVQRVLAALDAYLEGSPLLDDVSLAVLALDGDQIPPPPPLPPTA